jgi:hypothetical protein
MSIPAIRTSLRTITNCGLERFALQRRTFGLPCTPPLQENGSSGGAKPKKSYLATAKARSLAVCFPKSTKSRLFKVPSIRIQ